MPTVVSRTSPLTVKLFSVGLFNEVIRKGTFTKTLTGAMPKQAAAEMKMKGQTSPSMPFVMVTDLKSKAGDTVTVDLFNIVQILPTMGDRKLAGRLGQLTSSTFEMRINQCRGGIETGGRMTQQRTVHNLRSIAKSNLAGWNARLNDQISQIHVCGARGTVDGDGEWVVPLDTHPEFTEIVVNPVVPPTRNRRLFGGDATSLTNIDSSDGMTLLTIDKIRNFIDRMAFPIQSIQMEGDPTSEDSPLYVMYVGPNTWHRLLVDTSEQNIRKFHADAYQRAGQWFKGPGGRHPLFYGEVGLWNGILVKKMRRVISWAASSSAQEYDSSDVAQTITTAAVPIERCFILGAQALACAWGADSASDYHYSWHEEWTDHENIHEISTRSVHGCAKLRFTGTDGAPYDHGVITVDCYAPNP